MHSRGAFPGPSTQHRYIGASKSTSLSTAPASPTFPDADSVEHPTVHENSNAVPMCATRASKECTNSAEQYAYPRLGTPRPSPSAAGHRGISRQHRRVQATSWGGDFVLFCSGSRAPGHKLPVSPSAPRCGPHLSTRKHRAPRTPRRRLPRAGRLRHARPRRRGGRFSAER